MAFMVENRTKDGSRTKLNLTIAATIKTLHEKGTYADIKRATLSKELSDAINDIMGTNFKVMIDPFISRNANVEVPLIDKNNVMWKNMLRDWFGDLLDTKAQEDLARLKGSDKMLVGEIDNNGKMKGYFSKLSSTITISLDMIYTKAKWPITEYQATAIILHEIGHFVNFLRALGWTARTTYVLQQAHARMLGVGEKHKRVEIVEDICKKEGLSTPHEIDYLATVNDEKVTTTILTKCLMTDMRDELGADVYNARGFEALSDNFAAQHGAGLDLVMALDMMPSMRFSKEHTIEHLLLRSVKLHLQLVNFVFAPALASLGTLIALCLHNPKDKIYDDPKERFKRVKDALVMNLKENRDKDNVILIKQIEGIDKVAAAYTDERGNQGLIEILHETLLPTGREERSIRELQQALETLTNNKLYLSAAKFNQLTA